MRMANPQFGIWEGDDDRADSGPPTCVGGLATKKKSTDRRLGFWCPKCHMEKGQFSWITLFCDCGWDWLSGTDDEREYAKELLKTK